MNAFTDHLTHDRRLCILRLLKEAGGASNESVLHAALERLGHVRQPREVIRADLRFLIDAGLLTDEFFGPVQVVTLTRRGSEVAEGRITVEGVKPPSIGV
jgi:hypothetical protein